MGYLRLRETDYQTLYSTMALLPLSQWQKQNETKQKKHLNTVAATLTNLKVIH